MAEYLERSPFSHFLLFHLIRFPAIANETVPIDYGGSIGVEHIIDRQNLSLSSSYHWPTATLVVAAEKKWQTPVIDKEYEGTPYCPVRSDKIYGSAGLKKGCSGGLYWGSYEGVKIWAASRPSYGKSLIVASLFPQGVESWCQLLEDASIGARKHFATSTSLTAVGVHTTLNDVLFSISVFKKISDLSSFFLWGTIGRGKAEEICVAVQRNFFFTNLRYTWYVGPKTHMAQLSTSWGAGADGLITCTVRKADSQYSIGISYER